MQRRRRLTFQLTPLLDLLLIVIFAQYMEVQQAAETAESRATEQIADVVAELEDSNWQLRKELRSLHDVEMKILEERFQSILDQHQQAAAVLAETFNLPDRVMKEVLRLRKAGLVGDAQRLEQAVGHLKNLLESRNSKLLSFMIRYDEMQKHVSVWELHLLDNGQALFTDGRVVQRLSFESADEFAKQCFVSSNAFEEPRPLTLILMTHADTQAGFRRSAVDGLPVAVQRLRDGAGGTRWYDYSFMGFRPEGPLMHPGGTDATLTEPSVQP